MPESIKITVDNREIKHFNDLSLVRTLDHVGDGFSFTSSFFPDTQEYRDIFRPFSYPGVTINIGEELQFTGTAERLTPKLSEQETLVDVQGRSLPGRLVDCTFEKADFPVQFTGATLETIAAAVLKPFGLTALFSVPSGALFEEAGPQSPTETIFSFLHNLAKQRKLLMGQTVEGQLWFRQATTVATPVADLAEGEQGIVITRGDYNGSKRFSSYDIFGQEPGINDNYARLEDPQIPLKRPISHKANDTNAANIEQVSEWYLTNAIADSIAIPVGVEGWRKPAGGLWVENELITLYAPSIMIYKPFTFLIKSVSFRQSKESNTAELGLTIPGAYSGTIPEDYPWQE